MRVLRTDTEELVLENVDDDYKEHAILSHRWYPGDEEVTFADIQHKRDVSAKTGFKKLDAFRRIAWEDDFKHVWVDTCCIDKSSSQEVTESINAMIRWYSNSRSCYVYLHDLSPSQPDFSKSEWFTRGWTLQEMIAPNEVDFYDVTWAKVGTLCGLANEVERITGVHRQLLKKIRPLNSYSNAQKFSWAAERQTTKIEDRAYSLMGLFNINMGVIYGEGRLAFRRLQDQLLQTTYDDSIFAFPRQVGCVMLPEGGRSMDKKEPILHGRRVQASSLLADDLEAFSGCGNITLRPDDPNRHYRPSTKEVWFTSRVVGERHYRPTPAFHLRCLILSCCMAQDPTQLIGLELCAYDNSNVYFVRGDIPRTRILDGYELRKRSSYSPKSFGIIRDPRIDEQSRRNVQNVLMCRFDGAWRINQDSLDRFNADFVAGSASWNSQAQNLVMSWTGLRSFPYPPAFHLEFEMKTNKQDGSAIEPPSTNMDRVWDLERDLDQPQVPASLKLTLFHRSPFLLLRRSPIQKQTSRRSESHEEASGTNTRPYLKRLQPRFSGPALHVPSWTNRVLFSNTYDWSLVRHQGRFVLAKGFARKQLFEQHSILILEVRYLSLLQVTGHCCYAAALVFPSFLVVLAEMLVSPALWVVIGTSLLLCIPMIPSGLIRSIYFRGRSR